MPVRNRCEPLASVSPDGSAPAVTAYQASLAYHRHALAVRLRALKRPADAEHECQKAYGAATAVLKKRPEDPGAQSLTAKCLIELGVLDIDQNYFNEEDE